MLIIFDRVRFARLRRRQTDFMNGYKIFLLFFILLLFSGCAEKDLSSIVGDKIYKDCAGADIKLSNNSPIKNEFIWPYKEREIKSLLNGLNSYKWQYFYLNSNGNGAVGFGGGRGLDFFGANILQCKEHYLDINYIGGNKFFWDNEEITIPSKRVALNLVSISMGIVNFDIFSFSLVSLTIIVPILLFLYIFKKYIIKNKKFSHDRTLQESKSKK
jgi:hypothetical protein